MEDRPFVDKLRYNMPWKKQMQMITHCKTDVDEVGKVQRTVRCYMKTSDEQSCDIDGVV